MSKHAYLWLGYLMFNFKSSCMYNITFTGCSNRKLVSSLIIYQFIYNLSLNFIVKCTELDPDDTRPVRAMAEVHLVSKHYGDAKSDIEYLLWLDPDDQDALRAKELVENKIKYLKMISAFPIYA